MKETATAGLKGTQSPDDILKNLDAMINRMRGVKRKLEGYADEEAKIYNQVEARTAHLSELASMHTLDDVAYETWSRRRLDRLLVDYLLRHGYGNSASVFVSSDPSGKLRDLVDTDTFAHMSQIRQRLLRDHSVTEALAWCVDNKKELRKMESKLEFMLRFQQFIELVRTQDLNRLADAIAHARRYLTPMHSTYPRECNQAAVLMCFSSNEAPSEYAELWSEKRWTMLADLFTDTHNQLLSLPSAPLLHLALSSGLSALKTPACHATKAYATLGTNANIGGAAALSSHSSLDLANAANGHTRDLASIANIHNRSLASIAFGHNRSLASIAFGHNRSLASIANGHGRRSGSDAVVSSSLARNDSTQPPTRSAATATTRTEASVCPICSLELNELARHVPYAHHSKSHVENDLVLLPSGRVYSQAQLNDHARKASLEPGFVKDLRTGDVYPDTVLKKVYIT